NSGTLTISGGIAGAPQSSGLGSLAYTVSDGDQNGQASTWGNRFELGVVPERQNTARYDLVQDNKFLPAADVPLSTFAVDVDTASYSNMRRFIMREHRLPPKAAVRIEEMVNYFRYDYAPPPVSGTLEKVPD